MTSKVYKTAQGKSVDLGTIMLQNEHVRAVGNMNVNARGDKLDSNNNVVETRARQVQRQVAKTTTNVTDEPVYTSASKAKRSRQATQEVAPTPPKEVIQELDPVIEETPQVVAQPPEQEVITNAKPNISGGLAAAIARTKEVKQELEKTPRQIMQSQGVRKI